MKDLIFRGIGRTNFVELADLYKKVWGTRNRSFVALDCGSNSEGDDNARTWTIFESDDGGGQEVLNGAAMSKPEAELHAAFLTFAALLAGCDE
jgi:hypothetical protein